MAALSILGLGYVSFLHPGFHFRILFMISYHVRVFYTVFRTYTLSGISMTLSNAHNIPQRAEQDILCQRSFETEANFSTLAVMLRNMCDIITANLFLIVPNKH